MCDRHYYIVVARAEGVVGLERRVECVIAQ